MAILTQRVNELDPAPVTATDLAFTVQADGTSVLTDLVTPLLEALNTATEALSIANTALAQITALELRVETIESALIDVQAQMHVEPTAPLAHEQGVLWFDNSDTEHGGTLSIAVLSNPADTGSTLLWVAVNTPTDLL
jgi:hypothetical protein